MSIAASMSFDKAQDCLSRALLCSPMTPRSNYSLGMLYAQQNHDAAGFRTISERALALRPDYPEALNNLGVLFVRTEDYAQAEDAIQIRNPRCASL